MRQNCQQNMWQIAHIFFFFFQLRTKPQSILNRPCRVSLLKYLSLTDS